MEKIRIGIVGYGNLGRSAQLAVEQMPDMQLVGIFSRRADKISARSPVYPVEEALSLEDAVDVMLMCGGSFRDLPEQSPMFSRHFHIVDAFDNHDNIAGHFAACHKGALETKHTAILCTGWDPGLLSLQRLLAKSILPQGKTYTFWGEGVSQGHSDAIRTIAGVQDARQYTIPIPQVVAAVGEGQTPDNTPEQMHRRMCYVVAQPGANIEYIRRQIVTMPHYFAPYETEVSFISQEEMDKNHNSLPHGGSVIHTGYTGNGIKQTMHFALKLDSNPAFTAAVLCAYARAAYRLGKMGQFGAKSVLDIPPALLSPQSAETLRRELL